MDMDVPIPIAAGAETPSLWRGIGKIAEISRADKGLHCCRLSHSAILAGNRSFLGVFLMTERTSRSFLIFSALAAVLAMSVGGAWAGAAKTDKPETPKPPFGGTIFVNRHIFNDTDLSAFKCLTPAGRGQRRMFDRRKRGSPKVNAYLFTAAFTDGQTMEIQVNPEFGEKDALVKARKYCYSIGQMPYALRQDVRKVLMHKGKKGFGGGGAGLLIHTGMGEAYIKSGILTETFIHEASHTSLDHRHANAKGWLEAQKADGAFISGYSKSHPRREDVAETYLMYFAVRYKPDRIDRKLKDTITKTVPNRIKYFDSLGMNMYPVKGPKAPGAAIKGLTTDVAKKELKLTADQAGKLKALGEQLAGEIKKLKKAKAPADKVNRQFDDKALAILTTGQKKTFEERNQAGIVPSGQGESKGK